MQSVASKKPGFSSIPKEIIQDAKFEELISQGRLYSVSFHLTDVELKGWFNESSLLNPTIGRWYEVLRHLCLFPRENSVVVYIEGTSEGISEAASGVDIVQLLRAYKKRHGVSMDIYQYTRGIP